MSPPPSTARLRRMLTIAAVTAVGLAADLLTKSWAWEVLRRRPPKRVLPGIFHFEFAFNTGSAFGFLRDASWSRWVFVSITIAAVLYVLQLGWRWTQRGVLMPIALGLLVGGSLGNLHDRLFRSMRMFDRGVRHGVVDFLVVFYAPGKRWPAFNVADVLLVVGVVLLGVVLWRARPRPEAA